mmetsp:Transcript_25871/g.83557  ORF Transcript_25871/g.83557 Transcript_25871/m.83557 type:complete len:184 (+) Transcript_25871:1080-1631(+)
MCGAKRSLRVCAVGGCDRSVLWPLFPRSPSAYGPVSRGQKPNPPPRPREPGASVHPTPPASVPQFTVPLRPRAPAPQFIAMRTAGEIAILDCWSKCGTRTVQRGEPGALLLASCPGSRSILLFSPTERFVLEVGEQARVIFNPEAADAVPPPAPPPVSPMKGADCGTAAAGANQWPVAEAARH